MIETVNHDYLLYLDPHENIDAKTITMAFELPDSFAYFGDMPLFETWALTHGTHRDADTMHRCNWDVILETFNEKFGPAGEDNGWDVLHSSHWAVGWSDQLMVEVIEVFCTDDYGNAVYRVTPQFTEVMEIRWQLESYPVLDDERHSAMEHEETIEFLKDVHSVGDAEAVLRYLYEHFDVIRSDDIRDEWVKEARAEADIEYIKEQRDEIKEENEDLLKRLATITECVHDNLRHIRTDEELVECVEQHGHEIERETA